MSEKKILLIEDEPQVRRFLRSSLPREYAVIEAADGEHGLALAASKQPDIVLLDLGLPDLDGIEVTRRLREWTTVPIIILSARGQEPDKVAALDAGADDYLTKPFGLPELMARVRVAERHAANAGKSVTVIAAGELTIDLTSRTVTRGGEALRLTPIEYKLLATLAKNAGRAMTYEQLLKEVWGIRSVTHKQYLHVYMGHLRHKIERDPARPVLLITEPGVGYRLRGE